ncbi:MAG: hypothetical protein MUC87_20065 [Bacteroidia bacterium]|jgi:hypothetical protein|nr:hypothetical protein [Bacteroidia bacterium]
MKKLTRLLALGLFCVTLLSLAPGTGNVQSASISKKGFIYNKIKVSSNWAIAPLLAEMGVPDSVFSGFNKLHIYKKKGMVIFEKMINKNPSGTISEVQFYFDRNSAENLYNLSGNYDGALKTGKLKLQHNLTITEAKAKLKKWKLSDSYTPHSYRFSAYGVYMYLAFDESETHLVKVSVGKDSR